MSSSSVTFMPVATPVVISTPDVKAPHLEEDDVLNQAQEAIESFHAMVDTISPATATLTEALDMYGLLGTFHGMSKALRNSGKGKIECETFRQLEERAYSLSSFSKPLKMIKKWCDAGLNPDIVTRDLEGVRFVTTGDLLYSIKMFKDAKKQLLPEEMGIRITGEGRVYVKVEGEFKLASELKDTIVFDEVEKKYRGWSYTHPRGFVQSDSMDWKELVPIATLSHEAHLAIQEKAKGFWRTNDEIDPGVEKKCVLQVVTTAGDRFLPDSPLLRNVESMLPRHVRIRMVDEEGKVYSFSTKMPEADAKYVLGLVQLGEDTGFSLRTADVKIVSPDYEETRKFLYSNAASIPISLERFKHIKEVVEQINSQGGVRFCFTKQNCCRFCQGILKLAGVTVDTRMDGLSFLYQILPDAEDIPLIGKAVAAMARVISALFRDVVSAVPKILHRPMKECVGVVWSVCTFIPRMIGTLFINILLRQGLGAHQGRSSAIESKERSAAERELDLSRFERLIASPLDLFKKETSEMYHAKLMNDWIQRQGSWQAFHDQPSGFCVVDA